MSQIAKCICVKFPNIFVSRRFQQNIRSTCKMGRNVNMQEHKWIFRAVQIVFRMHRVALHCSLNQVSLFCTNVFLSGNTSQFVLSDMQFIPIYFLLLFPNKLWQADLIGRWFKFFYLWLFWKTFLYVKWMFHRMEVIVRWAINGAFRWFRWSVG